MSCPSSCTFRQESKIEVVQTGSTIYSAPPKKKTAIFFYGRFMAARHTRGRMLFFEENISTCMYRLGVAKDYHRKMTSRWRGAPHFYSGDTAGSWFQNQRFRFSLKKSWGGLLPPYVERLCSEQSLLGRPNNTV